MPTVGYNRKRNYFHRFPPDFTKKGRGQRAEGRRKEVLIKTLVVGYCPLV
ncbi:hypothetical protein GXM_03343 [Nostoc sphaeroides CCNUC1]|uniref:Uncharacterized protein n=1 Tax=Nostoc sphaeroides CCNUC1 TaxID=2653204 RepID=A0A5P8VZU9_9NOSO|nr:hypothetical protein GXM_03343 [Nostoc sphaeroides CCNUC1]